jgi:integrase/recombinase XerD
LSHWDDFLHRHYPEARKVRAEMFSGWTQELSHLSPTVCRAWQRLVRNWLLFHARDHTGTFIPDLLTFPKPSPAQLPRLVSEAEMARILQAARQLPPSSSNPLRAETIALDLLLLFCCGLRRGELLRLKLSDLDRNQRLLSIVETKRGPPLKQYSFNTFSLACVFERYIILHQFRIRSRQKRGQQAQARD